jgi:hypothetical protein
VISAGGGGQPQWRADQAELFYLSSDLAVMAVEVSAAHPIAFGPPRRLFRTRIAGSSTDARDSYALTGHARLPLGIAGMSMTGEHEGGRAQSPRCGIVIDTVDSAESPEQNAESRYSRRWFHEIDGNAGHRPLPAGPFCDIGPDGSATAAACAG